jgi:hypothetical protein
MLPALCLGGPALKYIRTFSVIFSLSACSGLTQMQDTIGKFDQAAHSVGTAQMSLFQQIQSAECNRTFYIEAFTFSTTSKDDSGKFPSAPLDLTPTCEPQELTNAQIAIRKSLLDTITLYADAIQTLASGTDNTTLSTNSQTLAGNIQKLASQQGFTSITATNTAALNAAVVTITGMILDHAKYKDIQTVALSAQAPLVTIVNELKNENVNDAAGLASKAGGLVNKYNAALLSSRDKRGPASFLDVVNSHNSLQAILVAPPDVTTLNKTLDALVAANNALAQAGNGGAVPEISDLISRAQKANTLFKSSR